MSNKSSVEQFAIALYEGGYLQGNGDKIQNLLEQHLEMEKERMIEFAQLYAVIHCMGDITKNADEYYNETYGGNK
jgi:transcriptional antiterminator